MNTDMETNLFDFSDKIAAMHLSEYIRKYGVASIDSAGVLFHILAFCTITSFFKVDQKLSDYGSNKFIEKTANYILTDIMGVKLRSFVITSSNYREKVQILRPMMLDSAKQFEIAFAFDDLYKIKKESKNIIKEWLFSYRNLERRLNLSPIKKGEEEFIVECFSTDVYELSKRN